MVEKAVTMGTVSTFFAAHRDCGDGTRIQIDLCPSDTTSPARAAVPSQHPHEFERVERD
jgi:hypothetical protein